jgi:predicted house-cleaning NTP pyrophosphatase (Maf/HAM1 superfamily)
MHPVPTSMTLEDPTAIAAATHPVRAAILDAMRTPSTAAAAARVVGQSRQNVAYHVRELEKVGLLRRVGERRNGNFVEQTYVVAADTLVISPSSTWGDPTPRTEALADQLSLGELVAAGERLQRESALLLDRAAFDGEQIASASVTTDIRFASDEARSAFLREYVETVTALAHEHGARRGTAYRLVLAAYPNPEAS